MDPDVSRAAELLSEVRRILVFTGAGVSTDSGIP
ncbi:MAG: NAD-dependent deacetylase, partial [Acidimicrobiia bacterium]